MSIGKWSNACYIVDGSIVGTYNEANGHYFAYGCLKDWQDTDLGPYGNVDEAKEAVEEWVDENDED